MRKDLNRYFSKENGQERYKKMTINIIIHPIQVLQIKNTMKSYFTSTSMAIINNNKTTDNNKYYQVCRKNRNTLLEER